MSRPLKQDLSKIVNPELLYPASRVAVIFGCVPFVLFRYQNICFTPNNSDLTELGTGVYVGGGAIGGTGPINHNSIAPYRYIQLQLRSGSAVVQVVTVAKSQYTSSNYFYLQYMVPETSKTLTCNFHPVNDTQTTFTCVSTVSDFQGWSTAIVGIK